LTDEAQPAWYKYGRGTVSLGSLHLRSGIEPRTRRRAAHYGEIPMYIFYGGDFTRAPLVQWVLEEGKTGPKTLEGGRGLWRIFVKTRTARRLLYPKRPPTRYD
jgi:hypothetical protein